MDWSADALYGKAKIYAARAHNEPVASPLFAFWMSLSLELVARAALATIHPALLADPKEPDNIHYAFGVQPKNPPKSIPVKAVFARCSIFITDFTDQMSGHGLLIANRRNDELHSGAAAFENIDNAAWLPSTYEVIEVLLIHMKRNFDDFLGREHGPIAVGMLKDRKASIRSDVEKKLAAARKAYAVRPEDWKRDRPAAVNDKVDRWLKADKLRRPCECPACKNDAFMVGEVVGRTPVRVDEEQGIILREARVLPNNLACPFCLLKLVGYQELLMAGRGAIYQVTEEEDPIEFFGIVPEDHVDMDRMMRDYMYEEYNNE